MGLFKDMLQQAINRNNTINEKDTHTYNTHMKYKSQFEKLIGEPIIWKTKNNTNLRQPQLVIVTGAYDRFVRVKKISYSVDGTQYEIPYCILYSSLYCGFDQIETLEFV